MNTTDNVAVRIGGQVSYFMLGNVFTLIVGLSLQIYVANKLGATNLGVFSLLEGIAALIAGLLSFGIAPTLVKYIPYHLQHLEYTNIKYLCKIGLTIITVSGVLAYLAVVILLPLITKMWPEFTAYTSAIVLMAILIPCSMLSFFFQQGLRGFQEYKHIVVGSSFVQLTVKALMAVLLLSVGAELLGYIVATISAAIIAVIWMAVGLKRQLSGLPNESHSDQGDAVYPTKTWKDYAFVMYKTNIVSSGTAYLDRFLLASLATAESVGVLAVVKNLYNIPGVFLQLMLTVTGPMFSSANAMNNSIQAQKIYNITTDWVSRASLPLIIFLFIFNREVLLLFGEEFAREGWDILVVLLIGQVVNLLAGPVGNIMKMNGQEKTMFRISVLRSALIITGIITMIPFFGLMGVAVSITVSITVTKLLALVIASRKIGLRWKDKRYLGWLIPSLCITAIGAFVIAAEIETNAMILLGLCLLFYAVFHGIYWLRGLNEDDKQLVNLVKNKIST